MTITRTSDEWRKLADEADAPYERKEYLRAAEDVEYLTRRWEFDRSLLQEYRVHCVKRQEEFDRLAARVAELETSADTVKLAVSELRRLTSLVADLQADAKRYRWLRNHRGWPLRESPGGSALDSYIDAAITETLP